MSMFEVLMRQSPAMSRPTAASSELQIVLH
jgi:hypothetical protein